MIHGDFFRLKIHNYRGLWTLTVIFMAVSPCIALAQSEPAEAANATEDSQTAANGEDATVGALDETMLLDLESRIAEVETLIAKNLILEDAGNAEARAIPLETIQARTAAYRKQMAAYQRHRNALRDFLELEKQQATFDAEREEVLIIQEEPPYNMAFLDGLLDQVAVKQMDVEAELLSLRALRELASMEKADIAAAKTALNKISEQLRNASQADRPRILYEVETAKTLVQASEAEYEAAKMELKRTETYKALLDKHLALAQERVARARIVTLFRQEELDGIIERQKATVEALSDEGQKARDAIERQRTRTTQAERALERATESDAQQRARDELDLCRRRMEAARIQLAIIESLQEYENDVIDLWQLRFTVANPSLAAERPDWKVLAAQLRERLDVFAKERNAGDRRAMSLRSQITVLETRLAQWSAEDGDKNIVEQQLAILREREMERIRIQMRMAQIINLAERILEEVRARQMERNWLERFTGVAARYFNIVVSGFDRELTEIGGESITGRKIFYMLIILVGGLVLARLTTRFVSRYVEEKLKLRSNVVLIIEKLTTYILFLFVVYFALNYVNIPLTIFTFLGGAIALGIGFGAQNLINNFLCGLILMGEQPIRLGDWVEIEGKIGIISNIGARASRLRLFSGVDVLIPNSKFLENNVINWTLSDKKVRVQISVGVAYGSPTRDVSRLMMRAVTEHGQVLDDPEPKVFFEEFGDNALQFTAYFWVEIGPNMDARVVMSDIRHRIDKLFREANISIAFPQRDIHLDAIAPLEVRLTAASESEPMEEEEKSAHKLP